MNSFYGGPNGQSFEIKKTFTNRYGLTTNSLDADLNQGWTSTVGVGEYVLISYGAPEDTGYQDYRDYDLDYQKQQGIEKPRSYNATVWVKTYDESAGNASGLSYKLVTSLTSFVPHTEATVSKALEPGEEPMVNINQDVESGYPDVVQFLFDMPGSWDFVTGEQKVNPLAPGSDPSAKLINIGTLGNEADRDPNQQKAYMGQFELSLPQTQDIQETGVVLSGPVGSEPKVELDKTSEGASAVHPILTLTLPVIQEFKTGEEYVITQDVSPDQTPKVSMTYADDLKQYPILTFELPKAWNLEINQVVNLIDDPLGTPSLADLTPDGAETKFWQLSLPRNAQIHAVQSAGDMVIPGDYYILENTGELFGYINGVWENLVNLRPSLNKVANVTPMAPYSDAEGTPASPTAAVTYNDSNGAWQLHFTLPKAPKVEASGTILDPANRGDTIAAVTIDNEKQENESILAFDFKVPAGSQWFVGDGGIANKDKSEIAGALNGDYYLDKTDGKVYVAEDNIWRVSGADLTGPRGYSLHVAASYTLSSSLTSSDIITHIKDNYGEENITDDMLFAVTLVDDEENTAYWYFCTEAEGWGFVRLTGGTGGLIATDYQSEALTDKAYSVSYINTLIEGLEDETGKKSTYSQARIDKLLSLKYDESNLNTWFEDSFRKQLQEETSNYVEAYKLEHDGEEPPKVEIVRGKNNVVRNDDI